VATRTSDPFHTTALGRAIASRLPADRQTRLLARAKLERRTAATIADRRRLAAEIEKAARQGYAIEESETDIGVACIGAPVCLGDEVLGAVSVSLPTARLDAVGRRRLVALVQKTAKTISTRLVSSSSRSSPRKESR
jgi:DNA-binding IclR family transcriptional regulator